MLLLVIYLHRDIFVAALVARSQSLVHCLCIDEELEGRTRLALGCYLVILPVVEVDVAHPCLHGSRLWLHSHESTVHEGSHILDTIFRSHVDSDASLVVIEYLNRVNPLLIIVVHGVWIVRETSHQILVEWLSLGDALDEVWNHLVVLILPRFLSHPFSLSCLCAADAPVVVEVLLHLLHLLAGCLLGILLHAGIYGGVDLQTAGVEVVTFFLAPVFQVVGYSLTEVFSLSVVVFLYLEVEFDRLSLQLVVFCM